MRYRITGPSGTFEGADTSQYATLAQYQAALAPGWIASGGIDADQSAQLLVQSNMPVSMDEGGVGGGGMGPIDYFNSLGSDWGNIPGLIAPEFSSLQGPMTIPEVLGGIGKASTIYQGGVAIACGLFPSLCGDSGQAMTSSQGPPPKAGLITGSCPPGRVRRTVAYGRDVCVRKARMNVLNPKALNRAARRMSGFHAFAVKAEKELQKVVRKSGYRGQTKRVGGKCGVCRKTSCSC